jgi:hypothetical protein
MAITSDPDADEAGVDTGYQLNEKTLRAPDISVGKVPNEPGWVAGAPPLAVEYADTGQDEADLKKKITELLGAGTRFIWVVRLVGPRRVDVYESGKPMRSVTPGQSLEAPGVLRNAVPVAALFDQEAAFKVALRNLAQREGYESFEAALANSRKEGAIEGAVKSHVDDVLQVLDAREVALTEAERSRLLACRDPEELKRWLRAAATAKSARDVFG